MNTWVAQRFPHYGRSCLAAGIFFTPVAVHRGAAALFDTGKITVLWFATIGALAFWFASSFERRAGPPVVRLAYPVVALLIVTTIATLRSASPAESLVGSYQRYGGLVPLVVYVGMAVAIFGLFWRTPVRLRSLAAAVAAGSVVVAISVLLQEAGIDRALWAGPTPDTLLNYPLGTIGQSTFTAGYLGIALPALWYLVRSATAARWRRALRVGFLLDTVALWFTQGRAGMVAGGVGLGAMALCSTEALSRRAHRLLIIAGAGVVVLVAVAIWRPGAEGPDARLGGIETLRTRTLEMRSFYWQAAGRIVMDHPLFGTGPDTFYSTYPRYRPAAAGVGNDGRMFADKPHNIFLERAVSSGLLGLGSYLAIVGLAVTYALRRSRQLENEERLLLAAFVGMLVGYLAQGLFSIDMPVLASVGWVTLGSIAVLADPVAIARRDGAGTVEASGSTVSGGDEVTLTRPHNSVRWAVHVGASIVVVSLAVIGLRPLRADVAAKAGDFAAAIRLDPLNAEFRVQAGLRAELVGKATVSIAEKRRQLALARRHYGDAVRLEPGSIPNMLRMANVETIWAAEIDPDRFSSAEVWGQRALRSDPNNQVVRNDYEQGMQTAIRRAVTNFQAQTALEPSEIGGWLNLAKAHIASGDPERAGAALDRALVLEPTNAEAKALRARVESEPR